MDKQKKEFAKRLRHEMAKKNITAYGLAKTSGISRQLISNYLHGRSFPKFEQLKKIAASLNINIFSLVADINISDKIVNSLEKTFETLSNETLSYTKYLNDYILEFFKTNVLKNKTLDTMVNLPVLRFCSCVF